MTELTKKKQHKKGYFTSVLVDTQDGSGDALVPLSDELMESLGWHEGDKVELTVEGSKIIVRQKA